MEPMNETAAAGAAEPARPAPRSRGKGIIAGAVLAAVLTLAGVASVLAASPAPSAGAGGGSGSGGVQSSGAPTHVCDHDRNGSYGGGSSS
jgi:hypothetical protein